jgi:hypothetical protein
MFYDTLVLFQSINLNRMRTIRCLLLAMYYLYMFIKGLKLLRIFWDITTRCPEKVNEDYGGTYRLHLQGWRPRNQHEAGRNYRVLPCWFSFGPDLKKFPRYTPPKRQLTFAKEVIYQKTELFLPRYFFSLMKYDVLVTAVVQQEIITSGCRDALKGSVYCKD